MRISDWSSDVCSSDLSGISKTFYRLIHLVRCRDKTDSMLSMLTLQHVALAVKLHYLIVARHLRTSRSVSLRHSAVPPGHNGQILKTAVLNAKREFEPFGPSRFVTPLRDPVQASLTPLLPATRAACTNLRSTVARLSRSEEHTSE